MNKSPLDFALFYATQKGWAVFPLKPHDKFPLFPAAHEKGHPCKGECGQLGHGFHDATKDEATIQEWWGRYPSAGIGIATGGVSGFFAVDIDPQHNGNQTFEKHIATFGQLPKTISALTGGGGHHYLFTMPEMDVRNSAGKLGAGLDTRGNGGYIAAAPSIHPSGNPYRWIDPPSQTPLAQSPEWILRMLFEQKQAQIATPTHGEAAFLSGQRNSSLTSLAGSMKRRGMSEDAILQALSVENLNKCVPPLTDGEVLAIVKSVMRYPSQAAPLTESRDRVAAEWAFCKTIYESPDFYVDFQNIQPNMFADKRLAEYWRDVLAGMGVAQAAANAEVLADIEHYNDWGLMRLDDYAKTIQHFARMSVYNLYGFQLQKASEAGDYAKIDSAINELTKLPPQTGHVIESISDVADEVEQQIHERARNPVDVWGIPYAWPKISQYTGGKQLGELTLFAGEPKIGKSWWKLQDILQTAITYERPVFYWCGEMARKQIMRRFYQLLGVNGKAMKTGNMSEEDWDKLRDAKALVLNSPIYLNDSPLQLHELRPMLTRMKAEYGIQEFVIDYAKLIKAPGRDEIEQTGNVSVEAKNICRDLELAGTLIASVNKQGMDNQVSKKANVRGSGQQIHDADVIYQLTTFPSDYGVDYGVAVRDYPRCVSLNITAGREFESVLEGGFIPYMRSETSPTLTELVRR